MPSRQLRRSLGFSRPTPAAEQGGCKSRRQQGERAGLRHILETVVPRAAGTYEGNSRKRWPDFRKEYEAKILPRLAPETRRVTLTALDRFEEIAKPSRLSAVTTQTVDNFVTQRQTQRGKKPASTVSPATINRELRTLKAVVRIAADWGYMGKVPRFRMVKEPEKMGAVITPEHFQAIYQACDAATMPVGHPCPADWWLVLWTFALTTGWRIGEIAAFRKDDLDLETGRILTRWADNKGGRDAVDFLTPVALEHVKLIVGFQPLLFFWPHDRKSPQTK